MAKRDGDGLARGVRVAVHEEVADFLLVSFVSGTTRLKKLLTRILL